VSNSARHDMLNFGGVLFLVHTTMYMRYHWAHTEMSGAVERIDRTVYIYAQDDAQCCGSAIE
jgi:hypothetical protein